MDVRVVEEKDVVFVYLIDFMSHEKFIAVAQAQINLVMIVYVHEKAFAVIASCAGPPRLSGWRT